MQISFSPINYDYFSNHQIKNAKMNSQTFGNTKLYQSLNEVIQALNKLGSEKLSAFQKQMDLNEITTTLQNTISISNKITTRDLETGELVRIAEQFIPKDINDIDTVKYANEILRLAKICDCNDNFVNQVELRLGNIGLLDKLGYTYKPTSANIIGQTLSSSKIMGYADYDIQNKRGRKLAWKNERWSNK